MLGCPRNRVNITLVNGVKQSATVDCYQSGLELALVLLTLQGLLAWRDAETDSGGAPTGPATTTWRLDGTPLCLL